MASGIKKGCNRPKLAKNLRSQKTKNFKANDPEAQKRYTEKLARRAARKLKKKRR